MASYTESRKRKEAFRKARTALAKKAEYIHKQHNTEVYILLIRNGRSYPIRVCSTQVSFTIMQACLPLALEKKEVDKGESRRSHGQIAPTQTLPRRTHPRGSLRTSHQLRCGHLRGVLHANQTPGSVFSRMDSDAAFLSDVTGRRRLRRKAYSSTSEEEKVDVLWFCTILIDRPMYVLILQHE